MSRNNKSQFWQKTLFTIGIIYVVSAPGLFFIIETAKEPAIFLLISGTLLAVLSRFDDVRELGLFGLKTKIEKAVDEAYATLDQVKEFAKIFAVSSLSNTARSGWWGGIPEDQTRELLKSTQDTLRKLGCSEQEIEEISQDFHDCQLTEYRVTLLGGGASQVPKTTDDTCQEAWSALRKRPETPPVLPQELSDFFEKYNFMTEEHSRRLDGYTYYFENKEFQDFDDFKNREKWPSLEELNYQENAKKKNKK
ncbi:MAG: hypothetical protein ACRBCT_09295 [Alphaproteobacteria bacterium]